MRIHVPSNGSQSQELSWLFPMTTIHLFLTDCIRRFYSFIPTRWPSGVLHPMTVQGVFVMKLWGLRAGWLKSFQDSSQAFTVIVFSVIPPESYSADQTFTFNSTAKFERLLMHSNHPFFPPPNWTENTTIPMSLEKIYIIVLLLFLKSEQRQNYKESNVYTHWLIVGKVCQVAKTVFMTTNRFVVPILFDWTLGHFSFPCSGITFLCIVNGLHSES